VVRVNLAKQNIVHYLEDRFFPILKQLLNVLHIAELVGLGKQLNSVDTTASVASALLNKIGDQSELYPCNILLLQDMGDPGDKLAVLGCIYFDCMYKLFDWS